MAQKTTRVEKLLIALERGQNVTKAFATKIGVRNLSAHVSYLRDLGYNINTVKINTRNGRVSAYQLYSW